MVETREDPYNIYNYFLFQSKSLDAIDAYEKMTQLRINRKDVCVIPVSALEKAAQDPKTAPKSWWNSFWQDGWSHLTFGTVSTAIGVGIVFFATGPVGWISGGLALVGGTISMGAGGVQLYTSDPETKMTAHQIGNASLSLNNIPGFTAGTVTYMMTRNYEQSVQFAEIAGLVSGGASLATSGYKAINMQRLYNLEVGASSTKWGPRTRNINAALMEINPKGLEGSHLVPQRVIRELVKKFPQYKREIENLGNGPLGINFLSPLEHALVDSHRFRFLNALQKETLAVANPIRENLIKNYPRIAEILGIPDNLSPTLRPVVNSLVITSGRTLKLPVTSSSDK